MSSSAFLHATTSLSPLGIEYPYYNNVNLDPRLVGFQAGLIPFLANTSAPRVDMYASHQNQAMVLDGGEFPLIFAGSEQNLGEYEFSKTRRDQDIRIIAQIPKYPVVFGQMGIRKNPSITVIYVGHTDNKLHYMTLDSYTRGSDGFGYENVWENTYKLEPGLPVYKETRLVTSPIHKNGLYCQGVNLNVAYMTREETIEDAMLVSESAAERMTTIEIREVKIIVEPDQYPLNTYGLENEIKFMPDIGEMVNEDGVLARFRPLNIETLIPDIMESSLSQTQSMHDDTYYVEPHAVILDITIHATRSAKMPKNLYAQADKYLDASKRYWRKIIDVYREHRQQHECSEEFNTLVSTAIQRLIAANENVGLPGVARKPKTRLIGKNNRPIEFMEITVVYMTKRKFQPGFKITGRDGQKGVTCRILPDVDMPVDDYGFRADLVIDPCSCIARMTVGPLYEPAINRTSEFVRRKLTAVYQQDPHAAWEILCDYCTDINPNYAMKIIESHPTPQDQFGLIEEFIRTGIRLHIPPGLNTIGPELMQLLQKKWEVKLSPVTFIQRDMDNNVIGRFRTKANVCIGSKYVYLLCKIPEPSSPGVAHINQYNTPMKSHPSDRFKFPIRRAPIRFGEDESRIAAMDLEDTREHVRLMCLQGGSPKGVGTLVDMLLTEDYPTRIKRVPISNAELLHSNTVVQVFVHQMSTMGLGTSTTGPHPLLSDLVKDVTLL